MNGIAPINSFQQVTELRTAAITAMSTAPLIRMRAPVAKSISSVPAPAATSGAIRTGANLAALAAVGATAWLFGIPALVSSLGSALVAAGLFLFSDVGYLYVSMKNCHIDNAFVKEPDAPGPGILRPAVTSLSLSADAVPLYASYLPDTLHQFEALVHDTHSEYDFHRDRQHRGSS